MRLTLKTSLIGTVALLVLLLATLSVIAVWQLNSVNAHARVVADNALPSIRIPRRHQVPDHPPARCRRPLDRVQCEL